MLREWGRSTDGTHTARGTIARSLGLLGALRGFRRLLRVWGHMVFVLSLDFAANVVSTVGVRRRYTGTPPGGARAGLRGGEVTLGWPYIPSRDPAAATVPSHCTHPSGRRPARFS